MNTKRMQMNKILKDEEVKKTIDGIILNASSDLFAVNRVYNTFILPFNRRTSLQPLLDYVREIRHNHSV